MGSKKRKNNGKNGIFLENIHFLRNSRSESLAGICWGSWRSLESFRSDKIGKRRCDCRKTKKMTPRCWKTCKIADFPVPGTIRSPFAILTRFMVENKKFLENNMLAMEVVPLIALSEERKTRKSFPFYQQLGECAQRRKKGGTVHFFAWQNCSR